MFPEATVPVLGTRDTEDAKPEPEVVDTSYPLGGVTTKLP